VSLAELKRTILQVFNQIDNLAVQRKEELLKMSEFLNKLDYKKFLESEKKVKEIEVAIEDLWASIKPDLERWKAEMGEGKNLKEQ